MTKKIRKLEFIFAELGSVPIYVDLKSLKVGDHQ
jgi:hypothetical protein